MVNLRCVCVNTLTNQILNFTDAFVQKWEYTSNLNEKKNNTLRYIAMLISRLKPHVEAVYGKNVA